MPHFEKATHIRTDYPALTVPGGHYGVIYARKKAAARQIRSRCQKAGRNEKSTIPDEFISIAGCKNRKYAFLSLNCKPLNLTPPSQSIPTGKAKKSIPTTLSPPLMRRQMDSIAPWPPFAVSPAVREKLMSISPAAIDRVLRKDKAALAPKGISLTKPSGLLKHRIPIRTFYSSAERKLPGFIQIDTVHPLTGP